MRSRRLIRRGPAALAALVGVLGGLALAPKDSYAGPPTAKAGDGAPVSIRRIALVVGANDGGQARETLRYAKTDASSLSTVLGEMGGVADADRLVLSDPSPEALEEALRQIAVLAKSAKSPDTRVEFFFYYSGHSDDQGLLLQETRLPYPDLKRAIEAVPAKVRVAVLDSCASGAFTRTKGGTKRAPFMMGSSAEVEGHAYLTSSSESEAAQESDRIKGSFFTHYLVTGLRGAADENKDRLVTLNEAYQYAYDETLRRTQATRGGPQHAAYDIRLNGSGDLVLTDLRDTTARVAVADDIAGRLYIRDKRKNLAAELYKETKSGELELALEPGSYTILLDDGRRLKRGKLTVADGETTVLSAAALRGVSAEETRERGDADAEVALSANPLMRDPFAGVEISEVAQQNASAATDAEAADGPGMADLAGSGTGSPIAPAEPPKPVLNEDGYHVVPFNVGFAPRLGLNKGDAPVLNHGSLSLGGVTAARLQGVAATAGANVYTEQAEGLMLGVGGNYSGGIFKGLQGAIGANVVRGDAKAFQAAVGANVVQGENSGGMQVGVGANWASKGYRGVQLSSIFNYSSQLKGMQLGLINISPGRVEGGQIGIINYAEESDVSIGLIPVTKKGGVWMDAWTSDVAAINLAVRLRAKYTYVFFGGGVHPAGVNDAWLLGGGVGGRIPIKKTKERLGIEIDLGAYGVTQGVQEGFSGDEARVLSQLRVMVHWRFAKRFAIFGGPTLSTFFSIDTTDGEVGTPEETDTGETRPGYGYSVGNASFNGNQIYTWPGFILGIQI